MSTAEMLAGTGSAYHVHREEGLTLVKLFFSFFLFLKIDLLDLGTCHGTQRGTWTHKRFTGNNLDFSKLTEPGSLYRVHREEIDHLDLGICSRTQQDLGQSTMFIGKKNWLLTNFFFLLRFLKLTGPGSAYQVHREENLASDKLFSFCFYFSKLTTQI